MGCNLRMLRILNLGTICRLVKWDMRDPRGVVQQLDSPVVGYESGKDYSRGTNFTCMATTGALPCLLHEAFTHIRLPAPWCCL